MSDQGKPNPIINAVSDAIGALRADDDMHDLAKAHEDLGPKAIEKLGVAEARAQPTITDAVNHLLQKQGKSTDPEELIPGVVRSDETISTANGDLHAFVYTPVGKDNLPIIVYFHGGGWVIASAEVYDAGARALAQEVQAIVVSVDYRLAPEHKFPAAWDDAFATYQWAAEHAERLHGDPKRMALAGESAGANLAMATALAILGSGYPSPRHVLAVYPVAQTGSMHTESYIENAIAKPLNKAMVEWFVGHLLNNDDEKSDTRIDLVNADLTGLPPVTIINATLDPLRSDGGMLEDALKKAGVSVERKIYTGVTHEFFGCSAVVLKAREAQGFAGQRLRDALDLRP
ncbi:alpha/beta hydrolase [Rhodanobacter sp. L36]|uniref:alpha/beta hydrolase n=1 Tax=Rhodanobacter sp. L36 TaxID=1747221 RepID=UPI00131B3CF7|nr:alpha/beta hydrolase [Rhodanobacter sp. L36]